MVDLRNEPEIFEYDRTKEQILTGDNYVENIHLAVGFASTLFNNPEKVFDSAEGLRISNELCAYVRLFKEGKIK